MKDKKKISYSIPAYLSNFKEDKNKNGNTKAKLKIFYVGETADGRIFDEKFSKSLSETISGTPVVAYYSTVKDDFLGHNPTQYVYGFVSPTTKAVFEVDDDGVKWFVAEVELFTNRTDNIGEIAKKIVGHPQSLELDPKGTEYEIEKENGKFKVHFTKSSIVGLSVLGGEQKPAFTGSMFFEEQEKFKGNPELEERFKRYFSVMNEEAQERGKEMDKKKNFKVISNFYELTYAEKTTLVAAALQKELGKDCGVYIADIDDKSCVANIYDYNSCDNSFKKFAYTIDENNEVIFGESFKVIVRYLTVEEIEGLEKKVFEPIAKPVFDVEDSKEEVVVEGVETPEASKEFVEKDPEGKPKKDPKKDLEKKPKGDSKDPKDPKDVKPVKKDPKDPKKEEKKEINLEKKETVDEEILPEATTNYGVSNTSTLLNSEKEELEDFRRQKKMNLINTYEGDLTDDLILDYKEKVNVFSFNELESKLAIDFRKATKEKKETSAKVAQPFSFNLLNNGSYEAKNEVVDNYKALVEKYK